MDNLSIIDTTKEEFKDFPITLHGEVLLEKTYDSNGNFSGYLTISVGNVQKMKDFVETEGTKCYEYKYKSILDTF